jgi:GDP-L-fucose synthase
VIPALIRKVVERHAPIEVWGDGKDLKEFIYVGDFIDGLLLAMQRLEGFEPINLAVGKPCTVREVLDLLLAIDGYRDARIVYDASKPTMIPKRLIDPSRAERILGFRARTGLEEGLRRTLAWYRSTRRSSAA